jgi:hypothetical protein
MLGLGRSSKHRLRNRLAAAFVVVAGVAVTVCLLLQVEAFYIVAGVFGSIALGATIWMTDGVLGYQSTRWQVPDKERWPRGRK